jgi:hypothetical protein
MNLQQRVLRKFRTLDGRRLIGHETVAIPYARLRIGLHVYEEVTLPPLDDGILRLVGIMDSAGLSVAEICRFLGVPPAWSDDRIVELRRQELITIAGSSNPTVRITDRGRVALVKDGDARPAFREVHAHLNLVTRRLELVDDMERISPCKCPAKGRSELEVVCARCQCINIARIRKLSGRSGADPAGADFALEALQDLIDRQMPKFRRRSSDLKRVRVAGLAGTPQHVGTFYREAILMGFHVEGGAPAVEVVVGGEVDPLVGDVVQAQSWVGEIKSDLSRTPADLTSALGALGLPLDTPEAKASIAAEAAVESVEEKLRDAEARLDDTEPGPQREEVQDLLSRLERDHARAMEIYLSQAFVKTHDPLQLGAWFDLALRTCKHRLLIESATISPSVVKPMLVDQLRTVLERGVKVVVAIGMPWGKPKPGNESRKAQEDRAKAERLLDMLAEIQRDHPEAMQLFAGDGDKHDKQLICDDWYVDGGKNWLSSPSGANAIDGNGTKIRSPLTNDGAWKETIKWYTARNYQWALNP